jgi:hypothetical protein
MDVYRVDYTNPTLGLESPMPRFCNITVEDKKLPPEPNSIHRRVLATINLGELKSFNFLNHTFNTDLMCVPYNLLHHKSNKKNTGITAIYNPRSHGQWLLQKMHPQLDFTDHEVKAEISKFIQITTGITTDIRNDLLDYFKYWLHILFQDCCDHIGLQKRPEVQNYADDLMYAADDIKACFIMAYTIRTIKFAFFFESNRLVLQEYLMEHRKMFIIDSNDGRTTHRSFCERLISSSIDELMQRFNHRFGRKLKIGCKWEIQKFRANAIRPVPPIAHPTQPSIPPSVNRSIMAQVSPYPPINSADTGGLNDEAQNNFRMMNNYNRANHSAPSFSYTQGSQNSTSSTLSTLTPTTVPPSHHQSYSVNSVHSPPSSFVTAVIVTPSTSETIASVGNNTVSNNKLDRVAATPAANAEASHADLAAAAEKTMAVVAAQKKAAIAAEQATIDLAAQKELEAPAATTTKEDLAAPAEKTMAVIPSQKQVEIAAGPATIDLALQKVVEAPAASTTKEDLAVPAEKTMAVIPAQKDVEIAAGPATIDLGTQKVVEAPAATTTKEDLAAAAEKTMAVIRAQKKAVIAVEKAAQKVAQAAAAKKRKECIAAAASKKKAEADCSVAFKKKMQKLKHCYPK